MTLTIYGPASQGTGQFDGGKITEQKPIGFPGEGSAVKRIGPLFYWAWFHAEREGFIPPHPHHGFEIITYVLNGHAVHEDSLGSKSSITSGGAQVMKTGSGAYHSERFVGPEMEGFQIWFEPDLREAVLRTPSYNEYKDADFPIREEDGVRFKTVIGAGAPIQLTVGARIHDVSVEAGQTFRYELAGRRSIGVLAVSGEAAQVRAERGDLRNPEIELGENTVGGTVDGAPESVLEDSVPPVGECAEFRCRDFMVVHGGQEKSMLLLTADEAGPFRIMIIDVPSEVDYPLYRK